VLRENLADALQLIHNVLMEPLSLSEGKKASLFDAAHQFDPRHAQESDLQKVAHAMLTYAEPTLVLVEELQLISKELESP